MVATERFQIPAEEVDKVRGWFRDRGGVVRWRSLEIGVMRPDQLTPKLSESGEPMGKPHWAYDDPIELSPDDIDVSDRTDVPSPPEWAPRCKWCNGTGRMPLKDRLERIGRTLEDILANNPGWIQGYDPTDQTEDCHCCGKTGRKGTRPTARIKLNWWGPSLTDASKAKADRLAKKLGPDVQWTLEHEGYGLASIRFYRETITPFTLD